MNTQPGLYGKKLGNTQIFTDDGSVLRVTVVETGPITVVGKRTIEKDGYTALILGLGERKEKHTTAPVGGMYKKANVTPKRMLKELRCKDDFCSKFEQGSTINIDEVFKVGQMVDVRGTSRGRGFSGVVRRWSFAGFCMTHGTHEYRRHGGSIGTNMTPGRTLKNLKMPGHYGDETVSVLNLKIARVDAEKNLILIEGGIPGSKNGIVLVRHAVKVRIKDPNRMPAVSKKKPAAK